MTPAETRPSVTLGRTSERKPVAPAGREPAEPEREEENEEQAEPKKRQRNADIGEDHARGVDPRALFERGEDARRHSDEDRDRDPAECECYGRAEPLENEIEHGLAQADGVAEISGQSSPDEAEILHVERVVQSHELAQLFLALGRHRAALRAREHQLNRIARKPRA